MNSSVNLAFAIRFTFCGLGTEGRCGILNAHRCRCLNLFHIKCLNSNFGWLLLMDLTVKRKVISLNLMNKYISTLTDNNLKDYDSLSRLYLCFQKTGECVSPVDLSVQSGLLICGLCTPDN